MRFIKSMLTLFASMCMALTTIAQTGNGLVYTVDPRIGIHNLRDVTEILVDPSTKIDISNLSAGKLDTAFRPLKDFKGVIRDDTAYWLKLDLVSNEGIKDWWLILGSGEEDVHYYRGHCYVDVYQKTNSVYA